MEKKIKDLDPNQSKSKGIIGKYFDPALPLYSSIKFKYWEIKIRFIRFSDKFLAYSLIVLSKITLISQDKVIIPVISTSSIFGSLQRQVSVFN